MTTAPRRPPVLAAGPRLAARAKAERWDRRRGHARRTGLLALGAVLLGVLGWVVTSTSLLGVRTVSIEGAHRLTVAQLTVAAAVPLGQPLLRLDTGAVAARVRQVDGVASVRVSRGWPSTLHVAIAERQPVAAVRRAGKWAYIDVSGTEFFTFAQQPAGLAVLDIARPQPQDEATRSALAVLVSLPPGLSGQISSVRAATPSGVVLVLGGGQVIRWGPPGESANRAAAAQALLSRGARVIDVSSPGVATTSPA